MKKVTLLIASLFYCLKPAYTQPGNLDPAFGTNGIVKTNIGVDYNYGGNAKKVLLQSDGSIYLITPWGQDNSIIIKKHSDGSADLSYGTNGYSDLVTMSANSAALQPDGKIVMVGQNDDKFSLARFNADGKLDATFSDDGFQSVKIKDFAIANAVAIQTDGKIVAAGISAVNPMNDGPEAHFTTARFNPDGSLDNTFAGDGWQTNYFGSYGAIANAVAIQPDGKIVVGGETQYEAHAGLIRYNPDGSRDINFIGEFGSYTGYLAIKSLTIQPDGKIVVAGHPYYPFDFSVARYNADGSPDITFPVNGITGGANSVALQNDGKIVAVGYHATGQQSEFNIARYSIDGTPDNTFDNDGKQTLDFGEGDNNANSVAIQSDGKIIGGGYAKHGGKYDFAVARYEPDGVLDKSFDNDGLLTGGLIGSNTIYTSTAIQSDGKVVAAGRAWNGSDFDFAVARYDLNGLPDNAFGINGIKLTDFKSGDEVANAIKIQSDGKIVVAGSSKIHSGYFFNDNSIIARYNPDGSLDNTFFGNGINPNYSNITAVAIQDDGRILIAGLNADYRNSFSISRINPDGSPDLTFGDDGTTLFSDNYYSYDITYLNSMTIQSDGKIILAGGGLGFSSSGAFYNPLIARLDSDGNLDDTFAYYGMISNFAIRGFATSVALQSDGSIAAVLTSVDNSHQNLMLLCDPDGNSINFIQTPIIDSLTSVAIQRDDKILAGGRYQDKFAVARFNKDGSPDISFSDNGLQVTDFSPGSTGINATVIADNKLYAAGFESNASTYGILARYLLDDKQNKPPAVVLTKPAHNITYLAPANILLTAEATDPDGKIKSVEFYNGSTLIFTEYNYPYSRKWMDVPAGDYTINAVATDDKGLKTTSAPVDVSVVTPGVSSFTLVNANTDKDIQSLYDGIVLDINTLPQNLNIRANTIPKKVGSVVFILDDKKVRTENGFPYAMAGDSPTGNYHAWTLPVGDHTLTAIPYAKYNGVGQEGTSLTIHFTVANNQTTIVSKDAPDEKDISDETLTVRLSPNPVHNILQVNIKDQQNKKGRLSILSASGGVIKALENLRSNRVEIDVSSLAAGVYFIKIVSGRKTVYRRFVKL